MYKIPEISGASYSSGPQKKKTFNWKFCSLMILLHISFSLFFFSQNGPLADFKVVDMGNLALEIKISDAVTLYKYLLLSKVKAYDIID